MTNSAEERIRQLTQGMLRKKLYVILSKGGASPDRLKDTLPAHLEFMIDLEKKGILFASGPLDGGARGDGLTIVRAASLEEAKQVAAARSVRRAGTALVRSAGMDGDGGLVRHQSEFLRSVAGACVAGRVGVW